MASTNYTTNLQLSSWDENDKPERLDFVNDNIKIDVKTAHKYKSNTGFASYSFRLEKENPTCDIYYIWCIEDNKMLIIPSKFLHQKQLCITDKKSKYDKFIDRFDYIDEYDKFYKKITI